MKVKKMYNVIIIDKINSIRNDYTLKSKENALKFIDMFKNSHSWLDFKLSSDHEIKTYFLYCL